MDGLQSPYFNNVVHTIFVSRMHMMDPGGPGVAPIDSSTRMLGRHGYPFDQFQCLRDSK